ncbi:hypothetical protein RAB80_015057 [Fusarium oxysporum f. sp. vasinfectum]|nr:hypothetical protein RAB80_015057 [Fusarium oxysporum f. sp. vasinfectum]
MSDKASPKKSPKSPSSGASEVVLHDAGHWAALAQDEQDEDTDSSLGVDTESSTASMTSSILNYRTIKGRTYHSERGNAEYWASNDAQQNEAMDIIHHFLVLTLDGKLHLAPLKDDIKSVLDVGTGTGIWAIDFADEHPQAEVIGTDISPIQPSWVPPNVKFEIEDCTQPWTFSPDSFDFIYMRYLYGSISDWSALFQEAFRSCKPGGWVESFEASPCLESDDDTVKEGSAMSEWGKFFIEGGKRLGRTFTILDDDLQKQGMEDAGFADIQTRDFKLPIGSWPKDPKMQEIGNFAFAAMDQDLEGFVLYMASVVLGWSQDEVTNALIQDTDLTSDTATARDFDQVTSELVETAKACVISIGCIWEAKIQRDEALRVHVRYDDLERKMRDLQDEMATACDESNAKNQAFDEWKSVASNEEWEGILAEELLIGVRIVDSNM